MNAMTGHSSQGILVLGMHRSGTSAATRVLNLLGAGLGARMMPPMPGSNEKGFWENLDAVDIDDRLLTGIGRSWHDVRAMPEGWMESVAATDAHAAITRLVRTDLATSPLWAVKDPRMCRLAPLWLRALADCGVRPNVLFVVRHPLEVAASLEARDGWSRARSLLLWTQHIIEAEQATRGCPRVMVTFDQILGDWAATMTRVSRALGVSWPRSLDEARAEIDGFLDVGARHHAAAADRADAATDTGALPTAVAELFERCARLSADDDGGWRDFQAFADEFQRFAALYGACMDDFIGYATAATGRVQHAGTLPRPREHALKQQAAQLSRALAALPSEGGDLAAVRECLSQHAGLVERLSQAVESQWARIASLEALLFAEHQSSRAVIAGESHTIRSVIAEEARAMKSVFADELRTVSSALNDELRTVGSALAEKLQAVRSDLTEKSLSLNQNVEELTRRLGGQADAISGLEHELAKVRRGLVVPTLRRWLGRSDV